MLFKLISELFIAFTKRLPAVISRSFPNFIKALIEHLRAFENFREKQKVPSFTEKALKAL